MENVEQHSHWWRSESYSKDMFATNDGNVDFSQCVEGTTSCSTPCYVPVHNCNSSYNDNWKLIKALENQHFVYIQTAPLVVLHLFYNFPLPLYHISHTHTHTLYMTTQGDIHLALENYIWYVFNSQSSYIYFRQLF